VAPVRTAALRRTAANCVPRDATHCVRFALLPRKNLTHVAAMTPSIRLRALSLIACCAVPLHAQSAFVSIRNADTVIVERFTRTATRLEGDVTLKGAPRQVYASPIDANGRLLALKLSIHSPGAVPDAPPMMTGEVTIVGDSAIASLVQGTGTPSLQRIKSVAMAQPMLNASFGAVEVLIAGLRRGKRDTDSVPVFLATGGITPMAKFAGLLTDSVTASVAGQQLWLVTDKAGRIQRGGIPAQGISVTRVDGIGVSKLGSQPDYSAPAGAPYTAEQVTVPTSMGHTLGGTLTKPSASSAKLAVVVSITGSGAQDRDEYIGIVPKGYRPFRQLADSLARLGIAMLRMDDRGYGASGGNFSAATSRDFANDVRAGIAYLRRRPDIDAKRIFLAGHSEGGLVAPLVAVDEPMLAGIVLMAGPARSGREILNFQMRYGIEHDTSLSAAKRDSALSHVAATVDSVLNSTPWLKFFGSYDPIATAKRVTVPVLIVQGGDDQQVIASEAKTLEATFKAAGNRDVTTHVFPQLNHLFIYQPGGNPSGYASLSSNLAAPDVIGIVAQWVRAHASVMP
jgi:uncharacterized protein